MGTTVTELANMYLYRAGGYTPKDTPELSAAEAEYKKALEKYEAAVDAINGIVNQAQARYEKDIADAAKAKETARVEAENLEKELSGMLDNGGKEEAMFTLESKISLWKRKEENFAKKAELPPFMTQEERSALDAALERQTAALKILTPAKKSLEYAICVELDKLAKLWPSNSRKDADFALSREIVTGKKNS